MLNISHGVIPYPVLPPIPSLPAGEGVTPVGTKTACILRWGAFGDHLMATVVLPYLKQDGFRVVVNCTNRGLPIYKNNPYVDEIVQYIDDTVPQDKLDVYWAELSGQYDRFINLSGSVEGALLKGEGSPGYNLPHEERHRLCDVNYFDRQMEIAGYPEIKGKRPQLFIDAEEDYQCRYRIKKHRGMFHVMWGLSGSSFHKTYPWAEKVAREFLNTHKDAVMYTVGEPLCSVLEWNHPRAIKKSGAWSIRTSMIMTKYVDLVVGPETGLLNAAACFPTPKIVLLSHSSEENLTKYWRNVYPLHAKVACYPCHQLHYSRKSCKCDRITMAPCCMAELQPADVLQRMEMIYQEWRGN